MRHHGARLLVSRDQKVLIERYNRFLFNNNHFYSELAPFGRLSHIITNRLRQIPFVVASIDKSRCVFWQNTSNRSMRLFLGWIAWKMRKPLCKALARQNSHSLIWPIGSWIWKGIKPEFTRSGDRLSPYFWFSTWDRTTLKNHSTPLNTSKHESRHQYEYHSDAFYEFHTSQPFKTLFNWRCHFVQVTLVLVVSTIRRTPS